MLVPMAIPSIPSHGEEAVTAYWVAEKRKKDKKTTAGRRAAENTESRGEKSASKSVTQY
jgi:hypothetical protein